VISSGKGGRPPVTMDIQLGIFLGKSSVSLADIRLLFLTLDCLSPSETSLQKSVTAVGETGQNLMRV
jgi:hypothetical protein